MRKVLVIEDDAQVREELKVLLGRNGYEADVIVDFSNICGQIIDKNPDMVLLDINLPDQDGIGLLKQLREQSSVPVIMVTSKNTEMDEVLCLSFGADDFVAKPYNPSILLLHIEAVFKRIGGNDRENIYQYGNVILDPGRGIIKVGDNMAELTKNEQGILVYLMENKGQIISRDRLMNYLWDSCQFVDDNTLTVNVNRGRKKLQECGAGDIIQTKRGQGYILG